MTKLKYDYKKMQQKLYELLAFIVNKKPPVDLFIIADLLGLSVQIDPLLPGVSGIYIRDLKQIGINKHESLTRQRFALAHEIAHHVLHDTQEDEILLRSSLIHREDNWESLSSCLKSEQKSSEKLKIEVEADIFSSWLLIPFPLLADLSEDVLQDYKKIAEIFHVSVAVAKRRMETLHLTEEYKQTVKLPKFLDKQAIAWKN